MSQPASSYNDDLRLAHVLADSVDSQTMSRFKALDLRIETKPDLTPVTDADKSAEEAIRGQLSRSRPRDAVLGEEFGSSGHGSRRWIIDPIDGTKSFMRGVPLYGVLLGLEIEGRVITSTQALSLEWIPEKAIVLGGERGGRADGELERPLGDAPRRLGEGVEPFRSGPDRQQFLQALNDIRGAALGCRQDLAVLEGVAAKGEGGHGLFLWAGRFTPPGLAALPPGIPSVRRHRAALRPRLLDALLEGRRQLLEGRQRRVRRGALGEVAQLVLEAGQRLEGVLLGRGRRAQARPRSKG